MPPPPTKTTTTPPNQIAPRKVAFGQIAASVGHRVMIYGPGGIGKTTLCCQAPGKTAVADADDSLPRLKSRLAELDVALPLVAPTSDWATLREVLRSDSFAGISNFVIDTGTKAEEWCVAHTLKTVPHEKGHKVNFIEDYGFGKGYTNVYEVWLTLMSDLDRLARKGVNVFVVCHDCVATVPNPEGEDYIRYEPRLQSPNSGKASIRLRMREWADHVLFLGYDRVVKDGVAKGDTKTLYVSEKPFCMAKSRTTCDDIPINQGVDVWSAILK